MAEWTDPKTWISRENITGNKLTTELQQNLIHLKERNMVMAEVRNGVSDFTQPLVGVWQPLFPSVLFVDIISHGRDLLITANYDIRNAGGAGTTLLDIHVQPINASAFFLSTDTDTPATKGLFEQKLGSNYARPGHFQYRWRDVPASGYRITYYWHSLVGLNIINLTNHVNQLRVEEYGKEPI